MTGQTKRKKKRPNPAFKNRPRQRRRRSLPQLSSADFNCLRKEFKAGILKDPGILLSGVGESVCDMALLMILRNLGLKSSNMLDLMCSMVPDIMKRYGIEKLPFKPE